MSMKTEVKKIDNYQNEVTVEYDAAELEKAKKRACKQISERISIPGFRKGKVPPAQVIEANLGKGAILDEASDILVRQASNDIINDLKLVPVTEMKHQIITCKDGEPFVCTLTFTPYPEVKLGDYKGLKVERTVEPVTDEQIDEQLHQLQIHHANMIDAPDAAVADGDFITLDFTGYVDGEKFEGGESKDFPLEIGSHRFIDNFEEQLIGAKIGDELDVKVTFPENYHQKDLADKPATFHCKINSIKHRELPELDDDFAKKASSFATLAEFKDNIKKNMEASAERRAIESQHDAAVQLAVDNMTVDLPPVMVEDRVAQMIYELSLQLQTRGMKIEDYMAVSGLDMDALKEQYREPAQKNVLTDILLDEVARAENIVADPAEVNYEIAYMAQMYRTTPKQIVKVLQENRQIPNIIANVRRRKVAQFIFENLAKPEPAETPAEDKPAEKVEDTQAETPAEDKPAKSKKNK